MADSSETPVEAAQNVQNAQVEGAVIQKKMGISLGSCIRGIDIQIHWSMFVFTIVSMIASRGEGNWWLNRLFDLIVYGPILYLTILVVRIERFFYFFSTHFSAMLAIIRSV